MVEACFFQPIEIRVFLLLDGLPSRVNESHLPGVAGFKAPYSPVPLLLSV